MTCPNCASERESRLRAERERDEARDRLAVAEDAISELHGLAETAIEDFPCEGGNECSNVRHIEAFLDAAREARKKLASALSSPAVTAEGKKLGEEGGGT